VHHLDPEPLVVVEQFRRNGGTAADDRLERGQAGAAPRELFAHRDPHRRNAGRDRDLLGAEDIDEALGIEEAARQNELCTRLQRDVRNPPRVDVKHRHDRHDRVTL